MAVRNMNITCVRELSDLSLLDVSQFGVWDDKTNKFVGSIRCDCNSFYDPQSPFYFTVNCSDSGLCSDYGKVVQWLYNTLDNHPELDKEPEVLYVMPDDDTQRALHFKNKETGRVSLILTLPANYRWFEGKVYLPA